MLLRLRRGRKHQRRMILRKRNPRRTSRRKRNPRKVIQKKALSRRVLLQQRLLKRILLRRRPMQVKQPVPLPILIRSRKRQSRQHLLLNLHQVRVRKAQEAIKEIPVRQRQNQHISIIMLHRHIPYIMMRLDIMNSMLCRMPMMSR